MDGKVLNYKLAWVDESNSSILHSKMFETPEDALKEAESKKDYMLFSLIKMDGGSYSWDLLHYGNYNAFKLGMFAKTTWEKYHGFVLLLIAAYVAYLLAFRNQNKT